MKNIFSLKRNSIFKLIFLYPIKMHTAHFLEFKLVYSLKVIKPNNYESKISTFLKFNFQTRITLQFSRSNFRRTFSLTPKQLQTSHLCHMQERTHSFVQRRIRYDHRLKRKQHDSLLRDSDYFTLAKQQRHDHTNLQADNHKLKWRWWR